MWRHARRISADGLAFHQTTVQRIEAGERPVRLDEAHVIAYALGSSVEAMVVSSNDTRVDATIAVDRFMRYGESIADAIANDLGDWQDEFGRLVEELEEAMRSSGSAPSDTACWLGAWTFRGVKLGETLFSLDELASSFDHHWEGMPGEEMYLTTAKADLADECWSLVEEEKRPASLAKLTTYDLYYGFLNSEGIFARGHDGEHQAAE